MPPMAGPRAKPTPKAAPSSPSSRARSSRGATSVTDAWATETLAPDAPSSSRARNSSHSEPASPVRRLPIAVPTREATSTGLRPMRSDSRPVNGEQTSWASENEATSSPAWVGVAPRSSE